MNKEREEEKRKKNEMQERRNSVKMKKGHEESQSRVVRTVLGVTEWMYLNP